MRVFCGIQQSRVVGMMVGKGGNKHNEVTVLRTYNSVGQKVSALCCIMLCLLAVGSVPGDYLDLD